jgi:hypothetical protein
MQATKHYAVFDNEGQFEVWSDPLPTKDQALAQGEMRVLDTLGSKDPKYVKRVNGLFTVDEREARYLKLVD